MIEDEVERVLANWIEEALSSVGSLAPGTRPAQCVASNFLRWWRNDFESHLKEWLGDAENALAVIRRELERSGGWDTFGEALHECTHLQESLDTLRQTLVPERK
jgi:hypothetical protein